MKKIALISVLIFSSTVVSAKSYVCVTEASGGVKKVDGKYVGTAFKSDSKYLLTDTTWTDFEYPNVPTKCKSAVNPEYIACEGIVRVIFNKSNLRFRLTNSWGYVESEEIFSNATPYIEVGTCLSTD